MAAAKRVLKSQVRAASAAPGLVFYIADQAAEPEAVRGRPFCIGAAIGDDGSSNREEFSVLDALTTAEVTELERLFGKLRNHIAR